MHLLIFICIFCLFSFVSMRKITFSLHLGGLKRLNGKNVRPDSTTGGSHLAGMNLSHVIVGYHLWRVYQTVRIPVKQNRISLRLTTINHPLILKRFLSCGRDFSMQILYLKELGNKRQSNVFEPKESFQK